MAFERRTEGRGYSAFTTVSPKTPPLFILTSLKRKRLLLVSGKTGHMGRLRHMEEFLVSILAKVAYFAIEALIVRLVRLLMPPRVSPAAI